MLRIPDSTRLKPLLVLSLTIPLLMLVILSQSHNRAMREQVERATTRRLQAIARTAAASLSHMQVWPAADQRTIEYLDSVAESAFIRIQMIELSETLRLVYDSERKQAADASERKHAGSADEDTIAWDHRELLLARTATGGVDQRQVGGTTVCFVSAPVTFSDDVRIALRISAPVIPGSSTPSTSATGILAGIVLTCTLAALTVLMCRQSQRGLARLAAAHRHIRRQLERDESLPGCLPRLTSLVTACEEAADRLDKLMSGQRTRISELEKATGFLETMLESMDEGVIVVDRDYRIAFANQAGISLLGASATPVGRAVLEVVRNPAVDKTLKQLSVTQSPVQSEFELRSNHRILSLFATALPARGPGAAMLVLHDVTELRRLENLRKEFVANVSHELKTPLAGIQAYAETLLNGAIDDRDACGRFVKRIQEQCYRLSDLVQDLLQLGRIEAGQEAFQLERVCVADVVRTAVEAQQPVAGSKHVSIAVHAAAEDLFAIADHNGLQTIMNNLIGNAVKYTPDGGEIQVRWNRAEDQVRIDVIDSGVGISTEHLPRIFERFYRVDEARSRDIGGTGLGLSIVKHLVGEFGGSVSVTSQPGEGSTFSVFLPAA